MMETTVVHFSGMQVMLMIALCAIAVLVPVWAIRRIARAVPPRSGRPLPPLRAAMELSIDAKNALVRSARAFRASARRRPRSLPRGQSRPRLPSSRASPRALRRLA